MGHLFFQYVHHFHIRLINTFGHGRNDRNLNILGCYNRLPFVADRIAYELLEMSALPESKRKRFIRGLAAAAIAFLVLFANQVL